MFRHYRVIFRELDIRYITFIHPLVKFVFITGCIYSHHTDGLHENYNNKIILAYFIINRTILIF